MEIRRREIERARLEVAQNADAIRARCQSLSGFVREAWHVLEPNASYLHNWHIDAICQHLEAVTDGRINRLLINVPPGSSKSLIVSVLWPAWEWGPCGKRSLRYITTAFNDGPVKRDTRKSRDLILSEWYQSLWPEVTLTRTGETSFANNSTGTREGVAFGSLTSQRGDRLIIDDPHSTDTAESPVERQTTTRRFREGAVNRLNDQERSAIVVIMQRLNEDDVSGVILKLKMGYTHLCLPMEFEANTACSTSIGFHDPRTTDGDLLDPVRFPRATVEKLFRDMGSYAYAGQYQQRPAPREGGMFKRAWFGVVGAAPAGTRWVRGWDLAASISLTASYTAGVKIGKGPDGVFYIGHVARERFEGGGVRQLIVNTAMQDGVETEIVVPKDPAQAGKVQAADYIAMLAGFKAYAEPQTGDKGTRAEPLAAQSEAGNVKLIRAPWNEAFIDEATSFPNGTFKDQVDAAASAFARLTMRKTIAFAAV